MSKFLNRDLGELAHQLELSPRRLRRDQVAGIDKLLGIVEANKAYPFEFVCYHITGYHKRGPTTSASIPGKVLIADLVALAEVLTRKASPSVAELGQPFLTHEEVARELGVSTKTIRRWRTYGLMAIRAVFADGVNRLVFLRGTVERFRRQNQALVAKAASFKQLTAAERTRIVARARELLRLKPAKLHALARVIAEETGRAVETVRYTLRRYDASGKGEPLFADNGHGLGSPREAGIWTSYQSGVTREALAQEQGCSVAVIDAVLRTVQVRVWRHEPCDYISNELFDAPDADERILAGPEPEGRGAPAARPPRGLPAYLQALYAIPLLTFEQEQDFFRRFNYVKHKAARLIQQLEPEDALEEEIETVRGWLAQADELKQRIVRANLRLVVSIARKHVAATADFFEVVSDGNMSLLRAVEKFDYARGNKFSTYGSWAIMKNYARSIPEEHYHYRRYVTGQEELLASAKDETPEAMASSDRTHMREVLVQALADLSEREREIVAGHFGLFGRSAPLTLEQLGKRFGVTKERVRQIERRALDQLREALGPNAVHLLAG